MASSTKPVVLHLGDDIEFNPDIYKQLAESFTVIQPSLADRQRDAWLKNLRDRKWGDFQAVFRPFWNSGLEMGRWDAEMIPLLPKSLKVFASAGAGVCDPPPTNPYEPPSNFTSLGLTVRLGRRRPPRRGRYPLLQQRLGIVRGCRRYGHLPHHFRLPQPAVE